MAVEFTVVVNVELRRDVRDAAELGGGEGGEGRGAVLTEQCTCVYVCAVLMHVSMRLCVSP